MSSIEAPREFCFSVCEVAGACTAPAEAFTPLAGAESLCIDALIKSQPMQGMPRATALCEQALRSGDVALLDESAIILNEMAGYPFQLQAPVYRACLPTFRARLEKREPTEPELSDVQDSL